MSRPAVEASVFDDPRALRALVAPGADREYGSVFPLGYYEEFLALLRERSVRTLTYRDLFEGCDDRDHAAGYPREHEHWARHRRDPGCIDLVIQHDVDFAPAFTRRMVALEALHSVRSSIFIFGEREPGVPPDSPYDDTPYEVDHAFFAGAERRGFVVGYHQNALSLTGDLDAAVDRFRRDVAALRSRYAIEFFCPHGGRPVEVAGAPRHNLDVPMPAELARSLRWVYNRHGLRFSGRFSDGGLRRITDPKRLDGLDLLRFARGMEPGKRYFALVHPQLWGYDRNPEYNLRLAERPWVRQAWERHGSRVAAGP